jgi:hypothetical protein
MRDTFLVKWIALRILLVLFFTDLSIKTLPIIRAKIIIIRSGLDLIGFRLPGWVDNVLGSMINDQKKKNSKKMHAKANASNDNL